MTVRRISWLALIFSGLSLLSLAVFLIACQAVPPPAQLLAPTSTLFPSPSPTLLPPPTPTLDRLAEPPLPSNPTQQELGRYLYWLNCMACHGDKGQGLTAEFRSLYVEDANCWARGCHGGRLGDQGFPLPPTIPAIISSSGKLPPFDYPEQLFEFLRRTHPPQHPGLLTNDQYWALTAYLWAENGRLPAGQVLPK